MNILSLLEKLMKENKQLRNAIDIALAISVTLTDDEEKVLLEWIHEQNGIR